MFKKKNDLGVKTPSSKKISDIVYEFDIKARSSQNNIFIIVYLCLQQCFGLSLIKIKGNKIIRYYRITSWWKNVLSSDEVKNIISFTYEQKDWILSSFQVHLTAMQCLFFINCNMFLF